VLASDLRREPGRHLLRRSLDRNQRARPGRSRQPPPRPRDPDRHPVSVETAEVAIRDLVRNRDPKRVKIEDIQKLVASRYNVSRSDILSERRTAAVVRPRQIAMYLSKTLTLRSLPEIGRRFGGRDHTTVLMPVRKIEKQLEADTSLSDEVELLKRMLQD
jgi:chromosomal replication initiator protein